MILRKKYIILQTGLNQAFKLLFCTLHLRIYMPAFWKCTATVLIDDQNYFLLNDHKNQSFRILVKLKIQLNYI